MPTPDRIPARASRLRRPIVAAWSKATPRTWSAIARIERQAINRPRYIVLPAEVTFPATFVADVWIGNTSIGRRTIKPWDDSRWYFELSAAHCERAGVDVGDTVTVQISRAREDTPDELAVLIGQDADMAAAWLTLAPSYRRQLAEWIRDAKRQDTRDRRAEDVLRRLRRFAHCVNLHR